MRNSAEWLEHFERNQLLLLDIPWSCGPELTAEESQALARSMAEFQRGENGRLPS